MLKQSSPCLPACHQRSAPLPKTTTHWNDERQICALKFRDLICETPCEIGIKRAVLWQSEGMRLQQPAGFGPTGTVSLRESNRTCQVEEMLFTTTTTLHRWLQRVNNQVEIFIRYWKIFCLEAFLKSGLKLSPQTLSRSKRSPLNLTAWTIHTSQSSA